MGGEAGGEHGLAEPQPPDREELRDPPRVCPHRRILGEPRRPEGDGDGEHEIEEQIEPLVALGSLRAIIAELRGTAHAPPPWPTNGAAPSAAARRGATSARSA